MFIFSRCLHEILFFSLYYKTRAHAYVFTTLPQSPELWSATANYLKSPLVVKVHLNQNCTASSIHKSMLLQWNEFLKMNKENMVVMCGSEYDVGIFFIEGILQFKCFSPSWRHDQKIPDLMWTTEDKVMGWMFFLKALYDGPHSCSLALL